MERLTRIFHGKSMTNHEKPMPTVLAIYDEIFGLTKFLTMRFLVCKDN